MKEKIGNLCVLLTLLATLLSAQSWRGDEAVAVRVNDSKGRPVADARVVFTFQGIPGEAGPDVVATSANGRAVLAELAPGPWQVEVSHPDYLSYIAMVDIRRGKKPLVNASFLEASGRSLSPVKVKFSKGDQQQASPVLEARQQVQPPEIVTPTAEESREPATQITEAPSSAPPLPAEPEPKPKPVEATPPKPEPAALEPETVAPTAPQIAATEPEVEEPSTPVLDSPAVEPGFDEVAQTAAATPPSSEPVPEPEQIPAAKPEPEKVEPTAPQITATEPVSGELPAPVVEPPAPEPEIDEVVPTAAATPTLPDPPPEPEQVPETMEVIPEEIVATEPATSLPSPQQQPSAPPAAVAPAPAPTPAPTPAPAPATAATALPPPPDPGALVTSHSDGSCRDCESAEWTLQVSVAAPAMDPASTGRCGSEVVEAARAAMQGLSTSIQLELDGFIGPVSNGSSQQAIGRVESDLAAAFGAELTAFTGGRSPCQIVGLVLPKAVRFSRVSLAAEDREEVGPCAPGQTCSIGDAAWLGSVLVERGPSATVVYGLFENRSADRGRRAILTAYYRPPNANWKPRLPAAD